MHRPSELRRLRALRGAFDVVGGPPDEAREVAADPVVELALQVSRRPDLVGGAVRYISMLLSAVEASAAWPAASIGEVPPVTDGRSTRVRCIAPAEITWAM